MRCLLSFGLLLSLTFSARAGDPEPVKPNTLTPKEIADGWILLFDGETTFGWQSDGHAKAADGVLTVSGANDALVAATTSFGSFDLRFESKGSGMWLMTDGRSSSGFGCGSPEWQAAEIQARFDSSASKGTLGGTFASGKVSKGAISYNSGPLTLQFKGTDTLCLRNVKLKPTGLQSIFNGKDLTGWKEIPGHKSKFSVNDKGELNIKDGNGDIQTEGQWADFVLQIEVFSNGDHLNSGVFFRCLPGEFWSGYEAQIRNQWQGDDRSKAVDYGTGGIYNRQPARKVVSSDREWFTMTVAAHGPHLATWVNGYQATDFTDKRPADKSARKGTKVDKGPLSLQGHDPTTDLNFRNIRIIELPK
jgi:hypothetical protein